jgi:hypothetical protein
MHGRRICKIHTGVKTDFFIFLNEFLFFEILQENWLFLIGVSAILNIEWECPLYKNPLTNEGIFFTIDNIDNTKNFRR